eukprot:364303-Chlamydomonas_euryale.AAC.12
MPHASRTPHTLAPQAVYDGYRRSFDSLRAIPLVRSHKDNSKFCAELRRHLDEHAVMLDRLAAGLRECRWEGGARVWRGGSVRGEGFVGVERGLFD